MSTFTQSFLIGARDIDSDLKLTNKGILGIFEDTGSSHSDSIGCGLANIEETNLSWIIMHWKVKVYRRPKYGEKIDVATWVAGMKKLFIYREYEVKDSEGNVIIAANSQWVLTHMAKGAIKIPEWVTDGYGGDERTVFDGYLMDKLKEPEGKCCEESTFKVGCSRIDFNGHMNNLQFLDVVADALPIEKFKHLDKDSFQIMYKRQSMYGENLKCRYFADEDTFVIKDEAGKHIHAIVSYE